MEDLTGTGILMGLAYDDWKKSPTMYTVLKIWQPRIYGLPVGDDCYLFNLIMNSFLGSPF